MEMVGVAELQFTLDIICLTIRKIAFLFVGNTIGLDKTIPDVVSLEFVGGNNARVPVFPADRVVKYRTTFWSFDVPPLQVTLLPSTNLLCCASAQSRLFLGVVQVPPAAVFISFDTSIIMHR